MIRFSHSYSSKYILLTKEEDFIIAIFTKVSGIIIKGVSLKT